MTMISSFNSNTMQQQQELFQQRQEQQLQHNALRTLSSYTGGYSYTDSFDSGNSVADMITHGLEKMDTILNQVTGGHGSVSNYDDINKAMLSSSYDADFAKIMDVNDDGSLTNDELLAFSIYQDVKATELKNPNSFVDRANFDGHLTGNEIHTSKCYIAENQDEAKVAVAQIHESLNLSA